MDQAAAAAALAKEQGTISSRFVSQDAVDEAKERQAEEWKAAYARYVCPLETRWGHEW